MPGSVKKLLPGPGETQAEAGNHCQNPVTGHWGEGTESQHFGDWAALMPKPESGIVPEDSDGAEFNGIFQG